jgi:hypothetical protein
LLAGLVVFWKSEDPLVLIRVKGLLCLGVAMQALSRTI